MLSPVSFRLRRVVFISALAVLLGQRLPAQDHSIPVVTIQVEPSAVLSRISPDFIGFGYETSAVAQSNYFRAANTTLVQLYRNVSLHGLIRIGGNVSDHTKYVADGVPAARTERETTIVNQANLRDLGDFARATGWKVMWGLNLGSGSIEEAVEEARAVDAALGDRLHSLQIGNEVEALRRFARNYDAYHAAYVEYKSAIRAVLPNAPLSGPDSIGNTTWITNFAAAEARDVKLLTEHYYRGGAGAPASTLDKLLKHDGAFDVRLEKSRRVCEQNGIAYRVNEVNSYSGGGKPGVSDTLGAALWCLDYMFVLASHGCEGVNMETDINQLGFISHYSPIVHDADGRCHARPEYYGMLAFAMAGKGGLLKLTVDSTPVNLSAYATADGGGFLWITVINKDFSQDAEVRAKLPGGYANPAVFRLTAPAMDSQDHVTLAGAEVSDDGKWSPGSPETVAVSDGTAVLLVPRASAALVRLRRK